MADQCSRCGRNRHSGSRREVAPFECPTDDGTSCRAYRHGRASAIADLSPFLPSKDGVYLPEVVRAMGDANG